MLFWALLVKVFVLAAVLAVLSSPAWWPFWSRHQARVNARRH